MASVILYVHDLRASGVVRNAIGYARRLARDHATTLVAGHGGGEIDNVFAWLALAGVFALPSRWEGSSMALLEALAVGVPVIASRQAGDAALVLEEGRYGLLVDAGDAPGLARAILRQCSPDAVRPGDRADAFAQNVEPYARLIAELLGP